MHTELTLSLVEAAPASLLIIHRDTGYDLINLVHFPTISPLRF